MSSSAWREAAGRLGPREVAPLAIGVAALVAGTAVGWDERLVDAVISPPPLVRAALVGASVVVGAALLVAALRRLGAGPSSAGTAPPPGLGTMVRGVRLVFLALAAFAAGAGWLLGHPLPIVIALVIAGVDVIETSFLLLVVGRRG